MSNPHKKLKKNYPPSPQRKNRTNKQTNHAKIARVITLAQWYTVELKVSLTTKNHA